MCVRECVSVWVCACVFVIDVVLHYRWRTTVIQSAQFKIMDYCHSNTVTNVARVEKKTWSQIFLCDGRNTCKDYFLVMHICNFIITKKNIDSFLSPAIRICFSCVNIDVDEREGRVRIQILPHHFTFDLFQYYHNWWCVGGLGIMCTYNRIIEIQLSTQEYSFSILGNLKKSLRDKQGLGWWLKEK